MAITVLLVTGSTRAGSTNTAVLRTAREVAGPDVTGVLHAALAALPAFDPDADVEPLPPAVRDLRSAIHGADAILLCTPEYAGALPGSFKNLLDWTVGDDRPASIHAKPVAWLNVSSPAAPTGGADAHESLAKVLRYVGADVVDAACRRIPVTRSDVGPDGLVATPSVRDAVRDAVAALVDHVTAGHDGPGGA